MVPLGNRVSRVRRFFFFRAEAAASRKVGAEEGEESMLMLEDEEIFRIVVTKTDRDSETEWLWPHYWWWLYYISLRCALVVVHFVFCGMAYYCAKASIMTGSQYAGTMMGFAFLCWLILLIACILLRIMYERKMLLFHTFRGTRDTIKAIEKVGDVLSSMSQVQISSGQYVCDRLAEVCDELKGVKDEA